MSAEYTTHQENWRPVVGYEAIYEVSDCGRVRSLSRRARVGFGRTRSVVGRVVSQSQHAQGYLAVALQRSNTSRPFLVHRIVVAAFIGTIHAGKEVNHKDGDKRNNAVGNLEIVTRQENLKHAVLIGLIDNKGEGNAQAKLTAEEVCEIRALYKAKWGGYKALGKRFGIHWGTIRNVVKRRTWGHLTA